MAGSNKKTNSAAEKAEQINKNSAGAEHRRAQTAVTRPLLSLEVQLLPPALVCSKFDEHCHQYEVIYEAKTWRNAKISGSVM